MTSTEKSIASLCCNEVKEDTKAVPKVKNVCAYNPRSCFIVPDQSFGVFSRV